jgi:predicted alpha/beta hydrolase family esterase
MSKQVLFIQGGGENGYEADKMLVASLQAALGTDYEVSYPGMQTDETAAGLGWPRQIGKNIDAINGELILVGHSFGASMLLKYLSENQAEKNMAGIFLLATPFWSGDEDWQKDFRLRENFAETLPGEVPLFFYHCRDDEEVPFDHLSQYKQKLAHAAFREILRGGHQLNNDLRPVAGDIKSL